MLDEFQQVLRDCEPQQRQPGLYRIDRRHAGYLDAVAAEPGIAHFGRPRVERLGGGLGAELPLPIPLGALEDVAAPISEAGRLLA